MTDLKKTKITTISRKVEVEDLGPDSVVNRYIEQGYGMDILGSAQLFAQRKRQGNDSVPVILLHPDNKDGEMIIIEEAPEDPDGS